MGPWEKSSCLGLTQLHRNLASTELNNSQIAWENSWYFSTPPLVSLWNDVWEMTAEISYCWGAWVVLLIGHKWRENCSQKHYSDLGRLTTSPVWNFCSHFQTSFCGETSVGVTKFWLLSSSDHWDCCRNQNLDDSNQGKGLDLHWIPQH